ncbi:hypothetical protein D3C81_1303680 [compost metagenome]
MTSSTSYPVSFPFSSMKHTLGNCVPVPTIIFFTAVPFAALAVPPAVSSLAVPQPAITATSNPNAVNKANFFFITHPPNMLFLIYSHNSY